MSDRQTITRELWRFLRIEPEEAVLFSVIMTGLVAIAAYQVFITDQVAHQAQDVTVTLMTARDTIYSFFNSEDKWGRIFLFGFWSIIGAVVYAIAWGITTVTLNFKRDFEVSASFTHPKSFHNSDYWAAILGRAALRTSAAVGLLFYCIFWLVAFAPSWVESMSIYVARGVTTIEIIDIFANLIVLWLSMHAAAILVRIALLKAHYSYDK